MATITAQMVKDLREKTGAGMMDCKKALVAVDGDPAKAVDWLRQKGMAKAATKSGRATAEGLISFAQKGQVAALASLSCETDFVARGDKFKACVQDLALTVIEKDPKDVSELETLKGDEIKQLIATIGENMKIGQFARHELKSETETLGQYIHANGKIGVLVWASTDSAKTCEHEETKTLLKELAMQVAASNPLALNGDSLDPKAIEHEREVYLEKARADGKPENIVQKIAEGAVQKFKKSVCLLDQPYIREEKKTISELIREVEKKVGGKITVEGYSRLQLTSEE